MMSVRVPGWLREIAERVALDEGWPDGKFPHVAIEARAIVAECSAGDDVGASLLQCVIDEVERLRGATTWQPMATAPRDGTEVVLRIEQKGLCGRSALVGHYMPGGYCVGDHPPINEGWYGWTGGMFEEASRPNGWMPLPESEGVE